MLQRFPVVVTLLCGTGVDELTSQMRPASQPISVSQAHVPQLSQPPTPIIDILAANDLVSRAKSPPIKKSAVSLSAWHNGNAYSPSLAGQMSKDPERTRAHAHQRTKTVTV